MAEKLITVREVSQILGILERDVIELARKKAIPSYHVGGEFLRFPRDEVHHLKDKIQKQFNILSETPPLRENIYNFFYFNDFFIISFLIAAILLGVIIFT